MTEETVLNETETQVCQIGIVVKDLDRTIDYLSLIGLGPFTIRTVLHPAATVRGKKVSYQVRVAKSQQGALQLEIVEYQNGTTIHKEFLDKGIEGLHHIQFRVHDIDATLKKFAEKDIQVLQEDRFVGGGGMAYLATDEIGGVIIEVVQRPDKNYDPNKVMDYQSK